MVDVSHANNAVDELNQQGVRYVKSPVVFMELARRHEKAINHAQMLDRLERFDLMPLAIDDGDWSTLRPGPHREKLAAFMQGLDESSVYVRAVCSAANHSDDYQRFLGAMFGEEATGIADLIHRHDPDLIVRVHNGVLQRKSPEILRQLGEVRACGDLDENQVRIIRHSAEIAQLGFVNANASLSRDGAR